MGTQEDELLHAARQFDRQALTEIYDRYSTALYAYAMRLLGNPELAEECVADTFQRFLLALRAGGGPDGYLKAYLYRIAHKEISAGDCRLKAAEELRSSFLCKLDNCRVLSFIVQLFYKVQKLR